MKKAFAVFVLAFLSGCSASGVVSSSGAAQQKVTIVTPGTTGANCFVQAGSVSYAVATPGTIHVRKSPDPFDVTCFKGEHLVGNARVNPTIAPREQGKADCVSCLYPETVSVAMALDDASMQRNVRQWAPVP